MDADDAQCNEIALRSNIAEVSATLKRELDGRLTAAGVVVDDARITHLAYAPEIAQAMLRRQQADAVISARTKNRAGCRGYGGDGPLGAFRAPCRRA